MSLAEKTLAYAKQQGAVICNDPAEKQRLADYIAPVAALFPFFVGKLDAGVYPYIMADQGTEELRECDGITWEYHDPDTGEIGYMIGISVDAMNEGEAYTAFLFMHELAHITTDCEHPRTFHDQLNELLLVYNRTTGANLANDMFGQQMRCDSRPYVLPDNIQVQQSWKGCAFRTEAKG